ncbi:hypothetical protein ACLB2K_029793 [Fragaria x ananassa]
MDKLRKKSHRDGDAQAAMTWMNIRGLDSELFYCRHSLDEEGRLANLFWRDHQLLLDYKVYSDVLIMDTTYKTNKKPLVVFVRCNNHRATVVFSFALICDEREDTYEWVFQNFLESMEDLQPRAILTDGDEVVRNVVERLMPAVRHRHGLVDNVWVIDLFNKRERWAEAFFRGHFYSGMCSMQHVEGMHSKLKLDLNRYTLISEMMPRMERSVNRIWDRVLYDNFRQKNSAPVFETHMSGVEEDTCRLFKYDIFIMIKSQILFEKQFVIIHRAPFPLTDTFELDGILCCHIFCVRKDQLVCRYPESLKKERWKKSVGDSTTAPCFKVPVDNKVAQVARYSALVSEASKACSNYSFSEEGFRVGMNELARLVQSSIEFRVNPAAVDASNLPPSNVVRDP